MSSYTWNFLLPRMQSNRDNVTRKIVVVVVNAIFTSYNEIGLHFLNKQN